MKTSRQKIIEFFELKEIVTAQEIASALHMTAANARHHLRTLLSDGVIVAAGMRLLPGRGRPVQVFQLGTHAGAHNLSVLSATLLLKTFRELNEGERTEFMRQTALEMSAGEELSKSTSLGLRLQNTVRKLNEMHYQARWEARANNPRLILGHCPYRAILSQFPELCSMDKYLAGNLVGAQMEQLAKLQEISPGVQQCIFRVSS